jgi:uncharacterized protein (DUF58 family)
MVPTYRFWALVALGIPIAAVAVTLGSPALAIAYDLALILVAYLTSRMAPDADNIRISRQFDPVLSARAWNQILLRIENDGAEDLTGRIRDEPPAGFDAGDRQFELHLKPGQQKDFFYPVRPRERGADEFRGTALRLHCPLGLIDRQVWLPTEQPVRVYPNVLALKQFDLLSQKGRLRDIGIRRSRTRGIGTEFESIRQYTEGDDYRKIDWKATARKGDVMVRQFEQERNQSVWICIDVGRHMLSEVNGVRKLDHVLDSLLMLANAANVAGDLVGLLVYSDTVRRFLPPRKGREQVGLVIEACHDLVAEPVESDFAGAMAYLSQRWNRRSLMITFTDCEDPDRAKSLLTAYIPATRRHLALLCRITDPRIHEVEAAPTDVVRDMYSKAAAAILTDDGKKALAMLTAAGVHVLDAEPQNLASALVNFYFDIKERGVL